MGKQDELLTEFVKKLKSVRFGLKFLSDAFPPNFTAINPSVDCNTMKSTKYRGLMRALSLREEDDRMKVADELVLQSTISNWHFVWSESMMESVSYPRFQEYLEDFWGINAYATVVAEEERFANHLLFVSDIFTLRPHLGAHSAALKIEGIEPQFRFRIKGQTDIAVFNKGGAITCSELLWAVEVKPKKKFTATADINRTLREGVLQLIGMNADNRYTSPSVIVTAFMRQHYILYLP